MAYSLRAYEYWLAVYRRVWRGTIFSSVLNPVLYLSALGIGLGKLVNNGASPLGIPYLDFVAPGLLAAVGMQIAAIESSFPVRAAIRWNRQYHAMLATPLRIRDLVTGHLLYVATRVALASALYLAVIAAFGAVHSPLAILAWPVAILIGVAIGAPVSALSAWAENEIFNPLFRFVITPMFLFSGTFFPVSQLPSGLRPFATLSPLWHGVELGRAATTGRFDFAAVVVHVAVLVACIGVGATFGVRAFARRLSA
jgi:lipooligosaccharide transport system permease protein